MTQQFEVAVEVVGQLCAAFGYLGTGSLKLKPRVGAGVTVIDLLRLLGESHPQFAGLVFMPGDTRFSGAVAVVLNGAFVTSESELNRRLKRGDSLVLVPQMVGG